MKDWRKKIENQLGKNAVNHIYSKAIMENNPDPVIVFFDEGLFAASIQHKNVLERMFPNVSLTCRNYSMYSDNRS